MFNYAPLFEVARILTLVPLGHKSRENGTPDMFIQCHVVLLRLSKDIVKRFPACNINFVNICAQNVQLCTIFKGRMDPQFGTV